MDSFGEGVGLRIKQAREAAGLNKSGLARSVGVSHTSIGNWEGGLAEEVSVKALIDIARVTGSNFIYLAQGECSYSLPPSECSAPKLAAPTNPKDLLGVEKPPVSLVPPVSILYEAMALRDGAEKYGRYNWRKNKVLASIYIDALERHMLAYMDGEDYAPDSGVHHLAHAKACLGILLDAESCGCLVDDRPETGAAARVMAELTEFIRSKKEV